MFVLWCLGFYLGVFLYFGCFGVFGVLVLGLYYWFVVVFLFGSFGFALILECFGCLLGLLVWDY